MRHKWMRATITLAAVGVAAAHIFFPALAIDSITAALLLFAVLPWLQPLFKSVELPGGLKVEFQDVEKVAARAEDAGLLQAPLSRQPQRYSFQRVAETDANLALAGLRIELERRLDMLARAHGYEGSARGIGNLLKYLNSRELINAAERRVLSDLVDLLNAAVHGAVVEPEAAAAALDIGPRILESLEQRAASRDVRYDGIAENP